uniref:Uncharacterized protein n=1 Tax=Arundo donax TaxID=35708 RepID=A0A0A9BP88_ARUDO
MSSRSEVATLGHFHALQKSSTLLNWGFGGSSWKIL